MRLALALGWSIEQVRRRISARELVMWEIADCVSPFGDVRGDLRVGQLCNILLALHGNDPFKLDKYLVKGKPPSKVRSDRKGSVGLRVAEMLGLTVHPHGDRHQKR